jgi:hypothetical protein
MLWGKACSSEMLASRLDLCHTGGTSDGATGTVTPCVSYGILIVGVISRLSSSLVYGTAVVALSDRPSLASTNTGWIGSCLDTRVSTRCSNVALCQQWQHQLAEPVVHVFHKAVVCLNFFGCEM